MFVPLDHFLGVFLRVSWRSTLGRPADAPRRGGNEKAGRACWVLPFALPVTAVLLRQGRWLAPDSHTDLILELPTIRRVAVSAGEEQSAA